MDARALAVLAGSASTTLFVVSYLPMLLRALRTRACAPTAAPASRLHAVYDFTDTFRFGRRFVPSQPVSSSR